MSEREEEGAETETLLWTCKEAYVYQIPPLKNESGHRANDWDVNKWLWSGSLRVTAKGSTLYVLLVATDTGELFATCPVTEPNNKAIDQVIDSSRYFVLRIDDGKGRHAFIGMGFRERDLAYDFNATVSDHWKSIARQKEADALREEMDAKMANEPMRDLSLKDGEKLSIKVNVPRKNEGAPRKPRVEGSGVLAPPPGGGLLAPPPKAGALAPPPPAASAAPAAAGAPPPTARAAAVPVVADDEFGDFADSAGGGDDFGDDFGDFAAAPATAA